jgi:predicted transcriptional regulator
MFRTKPTQKPLSELEHLLMTVLWKRSPARAEQVREALAKTRPLKESTIRTVLRRLEEKGYVRHTVDGRTNVYAVTEAASNVAVSAVRQIIDRFCGGSVEQLLLGMVDEEVLDKQELRRLADKVPNRKSKPEGKG